MYIVQAGIIEYLTYKDMPGTKICPLDLQSKDRQLLNSDLFMTYMIMVTGLCAAVAVFIGEASGSQFDCLFAVSPILHRLYRY